MNPMLAKFIMDHQNDVDIVYSHNPQKYGCTMLISKANQVRKGLNPIPLTPNEARLLEDVCESVGFMLEVN